MEFFSCNADSAISICSCECDPYNPVLKTKSRKRNKPKNAVKIRDFSYSDLVSSTGGFSADCFLGKGSHGSVYKALLDEGKLIAAVKRTRASNSNPNLNFHKHDYRCDNSCHLANSPAENEIEILSRLHNPRIVNLIGFCVNSQEKLLVVEFMPNGSLYDLLHSRSRPPGWTRRVRFALQVAKAVRALHGSNPPVIHRDIKSSNVLIDKNFRARLSDFGLALRGHVEDVQVRCTPPAGTLGYLDPGYLAPGDLTAKSDVFSYGILLLEIITGRNAIDVNHSPPSVVDWAVPMIKHGDYHAICDRRIGSPGDPAVIRNLAILAAKCVRSTVQRRPDMAEVVECLKIAKRKVHAPPIWNNLWRRDHHHVETLQPLIHREESDGNGEVERVTRVGSRRNRKISSVSSSDYGNKIIGSAINRVKRSRSTGSVNNVKMGDVSNLGGNCSSLGMGGRRRQGGVTVKIPATATKLSKSRSVGVMENSRIVGYNGKATVVFEVGMRSTPPEIEMSRLAISCDGESEKKMLEKPLVEKNQSS